jgi:hypothetical protein
MLFSAKKIPYGGALTSLVFKNASRLDETLKKVARLRQVSINTASSGKARKQSNKRESVGIRFLVFS